MSAGQYFGGVTLALVCLAPVVAGARRLRGRLLPEAADALAAVALAVIVVAILVLVLEIVGALGQLNRAGVLVGCLAASALAWLTAGARSSATPRLTHGDQPAAEDTPAWWYRGAAVATAVVCAPWLGWTVYAYGHGMETIDTLWYHMPFVARFVQTGSILHLQYFDRDPITAFYPGNSELLHGLGIVWFHSDLLSPLIDLGWAAMAAAAAWAIGRPFNRGPHCLTATMIVLGTPTLIDTQPGGAYNDVTCIALMLTATALLIDAYRDRAGASGKLLLAACATGLALGTKLTMIAPAALLAAGVIAVSPARLRLRQAETWAACLIVLGGFWYAHNLAATGNPLPSLSIHLGPLSLPSPKSSTPSFTVAQYLTSAHIWRLFYLPGLRLSLGLAWWAILAAAIAGAVGSVLAGESRLIRMIGALTVASGIVFLFTPQFLGLPGIPLFFAANVRYAAVPLVLGLVLLPLLPRLASPKRGSLVLVVQLGVLLLTELDPGVWPDGLHFKPFAATIAGTPAIAGALCALAGLLAVTAWRLEAKRVSRRRMISSKRVPRLATATVAIATISVAGWFAATHYIDHRYRSTGPLPRIYAFAQQLHHTRIGLVGVTLQYPLYGTDNSNYVQYVGAGAPHGGFGPITTCADWRRAINRGRYAWLLVTPFGFPIGNSTSVAPELSWTSTSGAAKAVVRERTGTGMLAVLLRITGPLDPGSCPSARDALPPGGP